LPSVRKNIEKLGDGPMLFNVVAQSDGIDAEGALVEILAQCRENLGERVPKAGHLFTTIDLPHEQVLDAILNAWPGLELIRRTTAGEMSSALGYREDSAALGASITRTIADRPRKHPHW
jgi:hypothetical protein